jgi:hypothetical protein
MSCARYLKNVCKNYVLYLDDRNEVPPVLAEDVLAGLQATHHLLILSFLFMSDNFKLLTTYPYQFKSKSFISLNQYDTYPVCYEK